MELIKTNSQSKLIKSFTVIILGSIALTLSAKLKIPFYPVPMTMQTFVVLFLGLSFGYKIGLATVTLYLLEGIAGLPVFSNSPEKGVGLIYFTGPTMGYLVGFLVASFLSSLINIKDNFLIIFLKLLMSVSILSNSFASLLISKSAREYLSDVSVEKDLFVLIFVYMNYNEIMCVSYHMGIC